MNKAFLEAQMVDRIKGKKTPLSKAIDAELMDFSTVYSSIIGPPARIEVPLNVKPVMLREAIRTLRADLERCDFILSEHLSAPAEITDFKQMQSDAYVCHMIGTILRLSCKKFSKRKKRES